MGLLPLCDIDMFSVPRPNLYESTEGFSVEVLGQTGIRYREFGKSAFVDSEVLPGPSGMVVYKDSIQSWEPPNENSPMTAADRKRILENIRAAFRFQGFNIDVI